MIKSMTGYGKGIAEENGTKITVEIKTVNHRNLDLSVKLPRCLMFVEDKIKKTVSSAISRGHADVFVNFEQTAAAAGEYAVDYDLAKQYLDVAAEIQLRFGLTNDLTLSSILRNSDIVGREAVAEDDEEWEKLAISACKQALDALVAIRTAEGTALVTDINGKLDNMQRSLDAIVALAPTVTEAYREKLSARLDDALRGAVDESRLATEIAIFADKCCIDEETTRLGIHIGIMRDMLSKSAAPVGRELDFRVQEMNRESNTIGSKANDIRITEEVLKLKNEIEKIREQIQNLE